jgi:hypothetical protein
VWGTVRKLNPRSLDCVFVRCSRTKNFARDDSRRIKIKGKSKIKVKGESRIKIKGKSKIKVKGESRIKIKGKSKIKVKGSGQECPLHISPLRNQWPALPRMLSSASADTSDSVMCSACCFGSYDVFNGYVLPETFASACADGQS